jgi:hypothetical protein
LPRHASLPVFLILAQLGGQLGRHRRASDLASQGDREVSAELVDDLERLKDASRGDGIARDEDGREAGLL